MKKSIFPGVQVTTLQGECDTDSNGRERQTPKGACGHISGHNHADHWDVCFPNGAWVVVTEQELDDPAQYRLKPPETLEQCALALKYGQDVQELSIFDEPLVGFTQDVAGNPDAILAVVAEARDLRDDACEMLAVLRRAYERWDLLDQDDNPQLGDDLERLAGQVFPWESSAGQDNMRSTTAMSTPISELEDAYLDAAAALRSKQAGLENHADELHRFIALRDQVKAHPDFSGALPETYYSGGDLDPDGVEGKQGLGWGESGPQSCA